MLGTLPHCLRRCELDRRLERAKQAATVGIPFHRRNQGECIRKLTLRFDGLCVDSFETGSPDGRRGTVRGHDTRVTEFCATPYSPCKPTTGCGGVTSFNCARHEAEEPLPPR